MFLTSTSREILGGPEIPKLGHVTPHDQFYPICIFFSLELTAVCLRAKFEVSNFNRSRDIRGSKKFQNWVTWSHMTPFDPILHFFRWNSKPSVSVPNLKFLASTVCRIIGGPKIPKLYVTPHDPFNPILHFYSLELTAVRLHVNFEVSISNSSQEIRGGPKIPKVGHTTPTWPLLTQFCIFVVTAHRRPCLCQILSLWLQPFARY